MADEAIAPTRLARVREILDQAAGTSTADYEGQERFWELPLEELLTVEIFSVRMIAPASAAGSPSPEGKGSCCGSSSSSSRGASSGLVRGLRGEPPFDGSRFPRLPWGGQEVPADEIQEISDWIDDGCPAEERELASFAAEGELSEPEMTFLAPDNVEPAAAGQTSAGERVTFAVHESPNELAAQRGELKQRMNIDCMSEAQIGRLRDAFRHMYHLNKWPEDSRSYNNLALIHQNHCQHGWERFLPWHRIYLYEFELALQDQFPDVTMPYWDWVMPQYRPRHPDKGWRIPKALQAFLTGDSIAYLRVADPPLSGADAKTLEDNMLGKTYATLSCFFKEVADLIGAEYTHGQHRNRFIDALLASNSLWYPLRYPGEYNIDGKPGTIESVIHYHYPKPEDIDEIMSLRTFRDFGGGSLYNDAFGFLDQNPHNTMHIWTGGMNPDYGKEASLDGPDGKKVDLHGDRNRGVQVAGRRFHTREDLYRQPQYGDMFSNLTAAYDPVFWPVHANVDRLWWEWQERNTQSLPSGLDSVLTPWGYTIADTLDMFRFGYEYVRCSFLLPVGLEAPVGRFVSQPIAVPETVRDSFQRAEVRLHRVPQLPRSCFIRVFLNLPEADATTSIESPHYAGYLAIFGHGPCYGGPGHCDIPPRQPRQYDLRPRNHNTPRNHRIKVTEAARRLLQEGADSLTLTLVVIGADYREDSELLRLEGVSLSFLD